METVNQPSNPESSSKDLADHRYQHGLVESVLTDTALKELKKQSASGCLLCVLDSLEAEDWD